ncbi:hypothetical protein H5397_07715 [Propioniciclava sp. MC1683]|uniref:hypothetical protein n=1 Tax=Propioniciclava sp. MC1683 TaxID=2760309 RepID=UPI0016013164|nr:hypothetical protein [Propioniciclava sp. MC1683]MBB1501313.1 hypothetical protein [Propioniciclava sp. MC1683]
MITRRHLLAGAATGTVLIVAGCTGDGPSTPTGPLPPDSTETPQVDPNTHRVVARTPSTDTVIPAGPDGAIAASRALLAAATAVVVVAAAPASAAPTVGTPSPTTSPEPTGTASPAPTASADPTASPEPSAAADPHTVAAALARELGIPAFVDSPDLAAELDRLQTRTVLAYGTPQHVGDREVVPAPATAAEVDLPGLPAQVEPPPVLALAAPATDPLTQSVLAAAKLTATEATHPGMTAATTATVKQHEGPVLAIGDGFGTDEQLAGQVEATRTAPELPGGGIVPFPTHHMVALYGHPQTAALGMMGEQPPAAAVERLNKLLEQYREHMPDQTVMGSFEIIATVASAAPGADGDYTYQTPVELLMPWIEAAEANDIYVVLDLQPGRKSFLTQAQHYEDLLKRPTVGLALDPEWRLKPDQKHLRQIGQVHIDEVNEVGAWLADLVQANDLPPKVLTLHQFQTRMIIERERLDTSRPEIQYLVHVDGQGPQGSKQATWEVIRRGLPDSVFLGWKNFEDEDTPMLTPKQTVEQVHPTPHFISYQ